MDKREEALSKTHYVFYSAANSRWVFMLQLFSEFRKCLGLRPEKVLRNSSKNGNQNVNEFKDYFKDSIKKSDSSKPFDHSDEVRARILSASYSLFDFGVDGGESALSFFNCNRSISNNWKNVLSEHLSELGLAEVRVAEYFVKIESWNCTPSVRPIIS